MNDARMTPPCGVLIHTEGRKCSGSVRAISRYAWGTGGEAQVFWCDGASDTKEQGLNGIIYLVRIGWDGTT
jgi:hypothetical protein